MHSRSALVLLIALALIQACAGSPEAETAEADIQADAQAFVQELDAGRFADAAARFGPVMGNAMPEAKLRGTWSLLTDQVGPLRQITGVRQEPAGPYRAVFVTSRFERATIDVKVVFDGEDRITGLWFLPGESQRVAGPPPYAQPDRFEEVEVTVGEGEWALPGTLALPKGEGPFPAVVLVHGSGPQDRDETVGGVKPFRDLAQGLASRGIAVLRYEKRTRAHGQKLLQQQAALTVKEEVVDDVLTAVELLRGRERIDPERIFVLGHSLGGMLVPRIARGDDAIAGFIAMAAPARGIEEAIMEQTSYVFGLDGKISGEEKGQLEQIRRQVERIRELKPSDAESGQMLLGASAKYWLDLRDYDPPRAAARMERPLLVLHGGRDYQVTEAEFERWKEALAGRPNATCRDYPHLNHLFVSGQGRSTPSEYQEPANVSEVVVRDIAKWIKEDG
ncbi:MAG: alpha/beta fold hydrolase [Candidatus Brocadiia bacterium]